MRSVQCPVPNATWQSPRPRSFPLAIGLLLCTLGMAATVGLPQERQFRLALPGYQFKFPRDHFSHPEFQTEWWYYSGNVSTADGRPFGFELAFFREGVANSYPNPSRWRIEHLYLAHLAVTDIRKGAFRYRQRMHRGALGLAGAYTADGGERPPGSRQRASGLVIGAPPSVSDGTGWRRRPGISPCVWSCGR